MINIDAKLTNADWPKRTPDTFADLGAKKWDESKHPRDKEGQFTESGSDEHPSLTDFEDAWAGGVGDFGESDAAYSIQYHPEYATYRAELVKELTAKHGSSITVYRAVTQDALEDMAAGSSGPIGVTTDQELAEKWAKFAPNVGKTFVILKTTIEPKIAVMRGKEEENEIVIDGDEVSYHHWEHLGTATDKGFVAKKWDESQHPRDKEGQFTTFYHGTVQEQIDSIKEHGLQTNRSGLAWPGLSQPGTIYLARTKHDAMVWAESSALRLEWKFDNPTAVVLEIRVPADVLAKSQRTTGITSTGEPEGNLRVFQDIPPEWIQSVTVGRSYDAIHGRPDRPPRTPPPVVIPPFIHKQEGETFYVGLVIEGERVQKRQWDESKHPRQPKGSGTHSGEFTETLHSPGDALGSLLNKERHVSIAREDVRTFIEKAGDQPEHPDLTDLHVEGMQIFGGNGLGISRKKMPQIPREHRAQFLKEMEAAGVKIVEETVDPLTLKPTQKEISARTVAEKLAKYEKGNKEFPPLLVSNEDRILDGHHHWGMMAAVAIDAPRVKVPIYRLKLKTTAALALMYAYMKRHKIKAKSLTDKWDEVQHPRDKEGKFTERETFIQAAIQRGEPHTVSENEFLAYHYTGHVPSDAYEKYEAGDMGFIHHQEFETLLDTREVNGETVEIRVRAEPTRWPKIRAEAPEAERNRLYEEWEEAAKKLGTTTMMAGIDLGHDSEAYASLGVFERRWLESGSDYVRDAQGNLVYWTPEEAQALGKPAVTYTVAAFAGGKAVGYAGDEFGATGAYVAGEYQRHGLGLALLKTYLEKSGRLAKGRQIGQMTASGQALTRALYRQLVKEAKSRKWDESKHPRDKEGQFSESFHGTTVRTIEGIKSHGLLASKNMDVRGSREQSVFVTTSEDRAHFYGQYHGLEKQASGYYGGEFAVVKVEIPTEYWEKHAIEDEEDAEADGTSFRFEHDIPVEWIKSIETISADGMIKKIEHRDGKEWKTFYESKAAKGDVRVVYVRVLLSPVQKADPATGRYVTPFVSFEKQGDEPLRMIASLNSSRLATWGFTAEAEVRGMARYKLTAVLDGRTSEFCRLIDGKVFFVEDAREKVIEVLNVQNPEDLRVVQPWPKQTHAALEEFREMSAEELTDRGLHIPPYHPHCRTICRVIESSQGEEMAVTPTIPEGVEVFHPVTAEDLLELGIEATPEDVAQWNEHIGMSPTELIAKLTGMRPVDVMTKGVGANPIQFDPSGAIGIKARGETPGGIEFKLGSILDPFTGIFYLTQADLLKGTPKAEVAFLKNLFSELINLKTTATTVAVGVAGNALYYAKLGFLPDDLEWDSIRTYALHEVEYGALKPVLASLAVEDQRLVKSLLQDRSAGALSALVELPFVYRGKTIGEHILESVGGTWGLDLLDDTLVAQAQAYLT